MARCFGFKGRWGRLATTTGGQEAAHAQQRESAGGGDIDAEGLVTRRSKAAAGAEGEVVRTDRWVRRGQEPLAIDAGGRAHLNDAGAGDRKGRVLALDG